MTSTLEVAVRNIWRLGGGQKYGLRILRRDNGDITIFISGIFSENTIATGLQSLSDLTSSFACWQIPLVMQPEITSEGRVKRLIINVSKAEIQQAERLLR